MLFHKSFFKTFWFDIFLALKFLYFPLFARKFSKEDIVLTLSTWLCHNKKFRLVLVDLIHNETYFFLCHSVIFKGVYWFGVQKTNCKFTWKITSKFRHQNLRSLLLKADAESNISNTAVITKTAEKWSKQTEDALKIYIYIYIYI